MQQTFRRVPVTPIATVTAQTPKGPLEIDPKLLKLIAGGASSSGGQTNGGEIEGPSPKGGWA